MWYVITLHCTLIVFNFMKLNTMHVFKIIPSLYILKNDMFNPSPTGLQTKGKLACPVFGPNMKSYCSRSLGKQLFDEYKHFINIQNILFQWKRRDYIKTMKNDTSPMKVGI